MNLHQIIKQPIITEKSLKDSASGVFTFLVDPKASKHQIANAVSHFFSVDVTKVTTTTLKGKTYRVRNTRIVKPKPTFKKARVYLKKGQKIDLFEVEK